MGQDTGYGEMPTSDVDTTQPLPLQDLLVRLVRSEAQFRMDRDRFLAGCRDHLHYVLQQPGPVDLKRIHSVIDIMDDFLNHRSRK